MIQVRKRQFYRHQFLNKRSASPTLDRQRLEKLIETVDGRDGAANHEYLRKLEEELERAETVDPEEVPGDVITMRSRVRLIDLDTGDEVVYTLVFPTEANFSEGKISVLAPVARGDARIQGGEHYRVVDPLRLEKTKS